MADEKKPEGKPLNGKLTVVIKDGKIEVPVVEIEGVKEVPWAMGLEILNKAAQAIQAAALNAMMK